MDAHNQSLFNSIASQLNRGINAKLVYGDPIEQDGTLIIPVAMVAYGCGGGKGKQPNENEGEGGGLGVYAKPIGYIEIKGGRTSYKPIVEKWPWILLAGGFASWLILRGIRQIINAKKQK